MLPDASKLAGIMGIIIMIVSNKSFNQSNIYITYYL